jgi:hypothetical protein
MFICIMIYHLYLSLRKTSVGNAILQRLSPNKENNGHEIELLEDKRDSEIVQAPTTTTIELREPLLGK